MEIKPQEGPQIKFLSSNADIAIYGGAAGGGKSWALLLEPLRHVTDNPDFFATFFRRTTTQIRNAGGLWDESMKIYPQIPKSRPREHDLEWRFDEGGRIKFAHLEHERTVLDWQGAQVPLLLFDELTHFTKQQFWYLLSRNRSTCGVRPYVRATCNPDADSWVAELISWWIDQETGTPIPDRSGVLRWFVRINDEIVWADTPGELEARHPGVPAKSLTFIGAKLSDNQILMRADPGYLANLMALPTVDRERLLGGNWKIRPASGLYFRRAWCEFVDAATSNLTVCRGWDLSATPKTATNDPDWTCGTLIGKTPDKTFYVLDHVYIQGSPMEVERLIKNIASQDGKKTIIGLAQDPGQAGKSQILALTKMLAGYIVKSSTEARVIGGEHQTATQQNSKITRFGPFSSQAQAGNVRVLRGSWNERWISALEAFPIAKHDDDADSTSRAFNTLIAPPEAAKIVKINLIGR